MPPKTESVQRAVIERCQSGPKILSSVNRPNIDRADGETVGGAPFVEPGQRDNFKPIKNQRKGRKELSPKGSLTFRFSSGEHRKSSSRSDARDECEGVAGERARELSSGAIAAKDPRERVK